MNKEKYLIFAEDLTSEDIANQDTTVQMTTSLVDPLALLTATAGTDSILEVQLLKHSDHTAGSAYTTTDGEYFTINSSGYTMGAGDGVATIIAASTDAVNGVTLSGTPGNNDFRVNLLQHVDGGTLGCFPASKFRGMQTVDAGNTDLYFDAGTGDLDAVDVVQVTHVGGGYKLLAEMVRDAISPSKSGGAVDFFIGGSSGATGTSIADITYNGNPAGITSVDIQLDS